MSWSCFLLPHLCHILGKVIKISRILGDNRNKNITFVTIIGINLETHQKDEEFPFNDPLVRIFFELRAG